MYDNRSGGILPIGEVGNHKAVFIKATLNGGKYPNEWFSEGERLKYYLKSRNELFRESYIENRSIIEFPDVPVYVFTRYRNEGSFKFSGAFRNIAVHAEEGGAKWFELTKISMGELENATDERQLGYELDLRVKRSRSSSREARLARLKRAPKTPRMVTVVSKAYLRNEDVIAEVLYRANGVCGGCSQLAPFERTSDSTPYLEVHHKIHLANGGEDSVENAVALCANCHRKEHSGPPRWPN